MDTTNKADKRAASGQPNGPADESVEALRARALAAETEAGRWRAIFESLTDGIMVFRHDGAVLDSNAAARDLLAIAGAQDELARPLAQRTPLGRITDTAGDPLPQRQWPLLRVLAGEVLTSDQAVDVRFGRADGLEVLIKISGAPLRDHSGAIIGAVALLRDATALRRLEERTREALEALLAMAGVLVQAPIAAKVTPPPLPAVAHKRVGQPAFSQASTPATAADATIEPGQQPPVQDATAQRLGQLTQRVLGCRRLWIVTVDVAAGRQTPVAVVGLPDEQVGTWWAETERAPFADHPQFQFIARLEAGEAVIVDRRQPPFSEPPLAEQPNPYSVKSILIAPMRVRDRLIGVLAYDYGPVEHEFGRHELSLAEGVAKLAALVLERERLVQEREAAQADALALRETNRRMDEFVGIVAHELRTPLTTIVANIQIAARQLKKTQARGMVVPSAEDLDALVARLAPALARSDRQAARLTRLVEDLLDLSRMQSGRLDLRHATLALAPIVREVVEEQRHTHPDRVIALVIPASLEEVMVEADADRIAQVVTNYLTNALKYSAEDRPVEVTLRRDGESVRVSVRDQGPGIAKAEQGRVWDRFYRSEAAQVVSGSGVGLGLGLYISRTIIERHGGQVGLRSTPEKGSTFSFSLPVSVHAALPDADQPDADQPDADQKAAT
ncbi:MAG TPA: ATP-binding protein [Ktedonobacterales bacterium]|nr:ATP-binding protein [Ktedonobacterales bacterium]